MAAASYFFVSWPWSQASEAMQRLAARLAAGADVDPVAVDDGGAGAPRVSALGQYFGEEAALRRLVRR